jgi:predicted transposase YbfD/YdcC
MNKGTAKRNENGEKKGALHLVSAVNHDNARLLAQQAVEDKSNEIPAVRRLIERFPHLDGATVTTDAMHCLDETARSGIHRPVWRITGLCCRTRSDCPVQERQGIERGASGFVGGFRVVESVQVKGNDKAGRVRVSG